MTTGAPQVLHMLAHPLRWALLRALADTDLRVQELAERLHEPMNVISYHLKKMREDAVVNARRSEADSRDVYYSLDIDHLRTLYRDAGQALHPSLVADAQPVGAVFRDVRVLFICTHNSARSQMGEALLRAQTGGRGAVFSAGSHPTRIHPEAVATMATLGIDISGQRTRHLNEFIGQPFDYVITVCDRARENCPAFPNAARQFHWGLPDPALLEDAAARSLAFQQTASRLQRRIQQFLRTLAAQTE